MQGQGKEMVSQGNRCLSLFFKAVYPGFIFIAEVYWGLEQELMSLGFDYCYDKNLYENLRNENITELKNSAQFFGNKNLAFIENHDEALKAWREKRPQRKKTSVITKSRC